MELAWELYEAATTGDVQEVRALLSEGADLRLVDHDSLEDDQFYELYRYPEVVRALLEADALDPNDGNSYAMLLICEEGWVGSLRLLLIDGRADPNVKQDSRAPIIIACAHGRTQAVRLLLLDGRADPAANKSGAVWWCARRGRVEILRLLMKDGRADPSADNNSAMRQALAAKNWEIVRILMDDPRVTRTIDRDLSREELRLVRKIAKG